MMDTKHIRRKPTTRTTSIIISGRRRRVGILSATASAAKRIAGLTSILLLQTHRHHSSSMSMMGYCSYSTTSLLLRPPLAMSVTVASIMPSRVTRARIVPATATAFAQRRHHHSASAKRITTRRRSHLYHQTMGSTGAYHYSTQSHRIVLRNMRTMLRPQQRYSCHRYVAKTQQNVLATRMPTHNRGTTSTTSLSTAAAAAQQTPEEKQMTADCTTIVDAAIQAVDPYFAVQQHLHPVVTNGQMRFRVGERSCGDDDVDNGKQKQQQQGVEYNLADYDKVVIVAFGKASSAMTTSVVDRLKRDIIDRVATDAATYTTGPEIMGLCIVKDGHATHDEIDHLRQHNIRVMQASHPVPDERSVEASTSLLDLVKTHAAASTTLVIACISGGGSALFCSPHPSLTLDDLQGCNQVLLQSGLSIQEMNVIRKRLELGKGGGLAQAAAPSPVLSLILSDIIGDPLDLIASGPTIVPDTSTWQDAWEIVQRLPAGMKFPVPVQRLLEDGKNGLSEESVIATTSKQSPHQQQLHHCIVGNNPRAIIAAADQAQQLGYHPIILTTQLQGEASQVAQVLASMALQLRMTATRDNIMNKYALTQQFPVALIAGGETTVTIPPDSRHGKGGRNQELALAAALTLKSTNCRQVVLASVGTDGNDGPCDAAGAIVDGGTVDRLDAIHKGRRDALTALTQHDAYPYLEQSEENGRPPLLKTGPTGTNVADICVVLVHGDV